METPSWVDRLGERKGSLSRRELDLVDWIIANPHEAAFERLQGLADRAGVSKPTVISCYRRLGYEDFQSFLSDLQNFYAGQIDSYRAGAVAFKHLSSISDLVNASLDVEITAIESLRKNLSPADLEQAAASLLGAGSVYVHGDGTGFYPGHYLVQRLRRCGIPAFLIGTDREHVLDELVPLRSGDVFLSFFYTQDTATLCAALDFCAAQGGRSLLVAGFLKPELCSRSSHHIFVPRGTISFKNSMAVPMAFAQLLLMAVEFLGGNRIAEGLRVLEMTRKGIAAFHKEES